MEQLQKNNNTNDFEAIKKSWCLADGNCIAAELEAVCEIAAMNAIREVAGGYDIPLHELARIYLNAVRSLDHYSNCSGAMQVFIQSWADREYVGHMEPIWAERYGWPTEEKEEKND